MVKTQLSTQFSHHLIVEMRFVFSDYGLRDSKPSYHMIEQKESGNFSILNICRHSLSPFCKVINDYDDVTMPPDRGRITMHKINTLLGKNDNNNEGV